MLESITQAIHLLNTLTPLGLCGGLAWIIYQFVNKRGTVRLISENHLSGLPAMAESLHRMEATLININVTLGYIQGQLSGRSK